MPHDYFIAQTISCLLNENIYSDISLKIKNKKNLTALEINLYFLSLKFFVRGMYYAKMYQLVV